ncbi:response regulator [Actinoplanes derwentensis]|uniref:DNA-binding response regulator, NarL/FixJ family, contains REC and HTH domains n=1 Tax=Actinoplanes derwentensis TaxID=113562 RepID=A0A1H2CHW4_9ACTN|nr:response regulator transcription factor [Actinoplanes derwentensis]GID88710.1 DNA-binding response regulator [Actinoplanes derwentensis]SDT70073.1 DNA-binding response regulator, NarL/FixJ family, contains REC and HTH domains [Actinoplanes derwentensis]
MSIRVLVADDHDLIRTGLTTLLRAAPGFEPVGVAADGAQAVSLAAETEPDIILMDIRMPVLDGISAMRQILAAAGEHRPQVIMLTTFDLDEYIYQALTDGASGFLLKDTPPVRILAAIKTVMAGDMLISPRVTRRLVAAYGEQQRSSPVRIPPLGNLTARETEVLSLIGGGLSNSQIAGRLVLSEATVKTHVKRLMGKLDLTSRAQAVVVAYERGLVVPGSVTDGNG